MRKALICVTFGTSILLSSCGNKVKLSSGAGAELIDQKSFFKSSSSGNQATADLGDRSVERTVDYAAETDVSEKSLTAWRLALSGHVGQAMELLSSLDKKYPNMKTVSFMKGQVQEHAGNKEEALKYYKAAVVGNEFDSMQLFKVAELERQTGENKQAVENYHKLLKVVPNFSPARLGLAKACLAMDARSKEAKENLEKIVAADPGGSDKFTEEAKKLLHPSAE